MNSNNNQQIQSGSETNNAGNCSKLELLLPITYKETLTNWLRDDLNNGFDYTGYAVGNSIQTFYLLGKSEGMLAGVPFVNFIFRDYLDCVVEWYIDEGSSICFSDSNTKVVKVAKVTGPTNKILLGERLSLNILSRCSGIATLSNHLNELKLKYKYKGFISGTRKTTPGFSLVEKYGMLVGNCDTHRLNMSNMVMLKDNHIWSISKNINNETKIHHLVQKTRQACGFSLKIEVECQNIHEAKKAIEAKADIIMLDNKDAKSLKEEAKRLKDEYKDYKFLIEASGGITKHNIVEYFDENVDIISLGALSQGVGHVDFSLKIDH